jgi:hypothetical protein
VDVTRWRKISGIERKLADATASPFESGWGGPLTAGTTLAILAEPDRLLSRWEEEGS